MAGETNAKSNPRSSWLIWWRIDPRELSRQVDQFHALGFGSARAISGICLLLSAAITVAFVAFKVSAPVSLADVVLMAILAVLVHLGHRWAMIGASVLWTGEKAFMLMGAFKGRLRPQAGFPR